MAKEFETKYDFKHKEKEIYELWEDSGYFNPDNLPGRRKKAFSIVLPPPNATGILHMGHAAMLVIEDILIRYHRMKGDKTVWIPGTDHAAIATHEKVERELYKKEKKTRHDLGREEFVKRIETFVQQSRDTITNQVKRLGASLDWSREAFTLDEKRSFAVRTAFKRMYDAGLIYKGHRIVNWDPKMQTTVSDDEIEWVEETAPFYYIQYGPFEIGTSRPETKFGDKYVVMHPNDTRYKDYNHGDTLEVEWINGTITTTIIKDEAVDMEFGTGVMTITPWHDAIDFEIAERHGLDKEQIIDYKGKLLPIAGVFAGEHISKARIKIVEHLKEKGLLTRVDEKYIHRKATNKRGGAVIEPQIMLQWFVDVNKKFSAGGGSSFGGTQWNIDGIEPGEETSLKELMLKVVENKQIEIMPERFEKTYFHWITNLRDWCISRQIWYGHRIPVWYCNACQAMQTQNVDSEKATHSLFVSVENLDQCPTCNSKDIYQDPDTLDTWFSSGLWTFSTLGWPEETEELKTFHPTNVLETGYDILFFWVARMILMTGFLLGDIPFKKVYLHGMVRDEKGRKMSKSLNNGIDPLEMAEKYGADATRLSLIVNVAPGNDLALSEDRIRGYRNFSTKLWNIARFITMQESEEKSKVVYTAEDKKNIEAFQELKKTVTENIESFKLHEASNDLYHYIWHTLADKLIEEAKPRLQNGSVEDRVAVHAMLKEIFLGCLKLLHPFMPFVTESIYQELPRENNETNMLMIAEW